MFEERSTGAVAPTFRGVLEDPMIRFPKRPIKTDHLDDGDILECETVEEVIATSELMAVDLEEADLVLAPASVEPEGVRNVMASLEAEVSRVLANDGAMLGPRAARAASVQSREARALVSDVASHDSSRPSAVAVHATAPVSVRPSPSSAPIPSSPRSQPPPAGSSPFGVAQQVVVPHSSAHLLPASTPSVPRLEPQIVVVREKPAFAWAIACLALGALGAIVGMRVASGLTKPGAPTPAPTIAVTSPPVAVAPVVPSTPAPPAPLSPEALMSATAPAVSAQPAIVAFDDKDAVHVVATPIVPPPQPAVVVPTPAPVEKPTATPKASTSAKPGDPPPLLPDAVPKVVVTPPPPPPPPKPARPKTPEEQLLEAQLKAASK